MPVFVDAGLPAIEILRAEGAQIAPRGEVRPDRRIAIVNLMPIKTDTEVDLLRLLAASPLSVDVTLVAPKSHTSRNTPAEHIRAFYSTPKAIFDGLFDGLIITGAPVEKIDFEQVDYWPELQTIMDYAAENIPSTLYLCWGAFAGLYHRYGIGKIILTDKISGVFSHTILAKSKLFEGIGNSFLTPHSRYTTLPEEQVAAQDELTILTRSDKPGLHAIVGRGGREFYVTGHSEYSTLTLDAEYRRDLAKGINPAIPENYYPADDPSMPPPNTWLDTAQRLFANWLEHFAHR